VISVISPLWCNIFHSMASSCRRFSGNCPKDGLKPRDRLLKIFWILVLHAE
jgi:hypothetical protein